MAFSFNMQNVHKFLVQIVEHWGPHKGQRFSVEKNPSPQNSGDHYERRWWVSIPKTVQVPVLSTVSCIFHGEKEQHGNPQSMSYYRISFLLLGYFKLFFKKVGLALCPEKPLPVSRLFRNVISCHFQEMPSFHEYATPREYGEGWPWEKAKRWMPRWEKNIIESCLALAYSWN